ncbi:hypothetical protein FACS1894192_03570 [Bacilli bacterium]|nr:hypothetical protein FACS1894192_03570 [Bacilli bacterium]
MKNIKLLSTLALSATLLTASAGLASAAVVDGTGKATETTAGSAGFVKDSTTVIDPQKPGGKGPEGPGDITDPQKPDILDPNVTVSDLAIYAHPKEFNFGIKKISAADQVGTKVVLTQKDWFTAGNDASDVDASKDPAAKHSETYQSLRVYDGRVVNDGWAVSVDATPFVDGAKTLTGAEIKIDGASAYTTDANGKVAGKSALTITTDGTAVSDILKADSTARFYSDIQWDTNKVSLEVPAAVITTGNFSSTVTWTMTGTPDA